MQVQPYIFFEGRCKEAVNFYKSALNAEITMMMRYKDNPKPQDAGGGCGPDVSKIKGDSIMHVSFKVGDTEILASDGMATGRPEFKGITLSLNPASEAAARRIFSALSEGGEVTLPLSKTFYSPCFGMIVDKFGVSWMVNVPGDIPPK